MRRYHALRKMPQAERLAEAQRLVEHPEELATEFAAGVAQFAPYSNVADHFYPHERVAGQVDAELKRTNDLVLRLEAAKQVIPTDAPDRLMEHDAGLGVTAVPATRLGFDFVDRELLVQRTTSPAEWEDGRLNRGGVRLDVLLADREDRTPVVAELKLPGDMDPPFFALVQALTCAAHLATANQYERMRRHLHRGNFPDLSGGAPRLDVWVLFVDASGQARRQQPKGKYMDDLKSNVRRVGATASLGPNATASRSKVLATSSALLDRRTVLPVALAFNPPNLRSHPRPRPRGRPHDGAVATTPSCRPRTPPRAVLTIDSCISAFSCTRRSRAAAISSTRRPGESSGVAASSAASLALPIVATSSSRDPHQHQRRLPVRQQFLFASGHAEGGGFCRMPWLYQATFPFASLMAGPSARCSLPWMYQRCSPVERSTAGPSSRCSSPL